VTDNRRRQEIEERALQMARDENKQRRSSMLEKLQAERDKIHSEVKRLELSAQRRKTTFKIREANKISQKLNKFTVR
jgi:hypothetical protein